MNINLREPGAERKYFIIVDRNAGILHARNTPRFVAMMPAPSFCPSLNLFQKLFNWKIKGIFIRKIKVPQI